MGTHDALINKLWQGDDDRKIARAFVAKFGGMPGMEDRIPAMLQEAAATADKVAAGKLSLDDGRSFLASFAQDGLGLPAHVMQDLGTWFDNPGVDVVATETPQQLEAAPAQAQPAQPAQAQRPAAAAPTQPGATLANADARISEIQGMMRAPQGSDAWKGYWMGEAGAKMQQEYRDLLALKAAGTEMPSASQTLAGGAALPAQPAAASPAEPAPAA